MKPTILVLMMASLMIAASLPAASAQNNGAWRGQDNEFGSIRTLYNVEMAGERVPVEAKIVLRNNYEDKDARFFMFGWTVEHTPLDVTFDHLIRADTGEEMPCYQTEGDRTTSIRCFVDLRHMPPPGTEIVMHGTVGSGKVGNFQVGAIVLPFTYTWDDIRMSNGLPAELYGYTQVFVRDATSGGNRLGGLGNQIPGLGVVGLGIAAVGALAIAAKRRPE